MGKRVKRGDPLVIAADDWNAMLDAVDAVKRLARTRPARGASATDRDIVVVENASGSTVERGEVLGLDDVLVTPAANEDGFVRNPMFSGVTPATGDHEGRFAVMVGPVKYGLVGRGVVAGTVVARVNVSDADHQFAEIQNGSTVLASAANGSARILWKPSGTGEKWAVVRLGDGQGEGAPLSDDTPEPVADEGDAGDSGEAARANHKHAGVSTLAKSGEVGLTGDVTLTAGSNVTLTQEGQDISIEAASAPETDAANKLVRIVERTASGHVSTYTVIEIDPEDHSTTIGENITGVRIQDGNDPSGVPAGTIVGPLFESPGGVKYCWPFAIAR